MALKNIKKSISLYERMQCVIENLDQTYKERGEKI
jgi:hypothetical protein